MHMYFYAFVWFVYTPFVDSRALVFYMLLSLVLSVWVVNVSVSDMELVVWKRVFHVAKAFCKKLWSPGTVCIMSTFLP